MKYRFEKATDESLNVTSNGILIGILRWNEGREPIFHVSNITEIPAALMDTCLKELEKRGIALPLGTSQSSLENDDD